MNSKSNVFTFKSKLKDNCPFIIFISGTCGSGKSTIGKLLADKLDFEFLDGDDFHSAENCSKMALGIPLNDMDRLPLLEKLAELANEIFLPSVLQKKRVIACSALKFAYRKILVGKICPTQCCVVMLKVSKAVLVKRLESRSGHFFDKKLLNSQLQTLELPLFNADNNNIKKPYLLIIDGDQSIQCIFNSIIDQLSLRLKNKKQKFN